MKVTQADVAEYEAEGYEVRQERSAGGQLLHVLYKDGKPSGTCLDWLPEHSSLAARQARQAAVEAASRRLEEAASRRLRAARAAREFPERGDDPRSAPSRAPAEPGREAGQ